MNHQALTDLLAKIEAGEATMVDIHAALQRNGLNATGAYNGSLDAAKALHDAVLTGWYAKTDTEGKCYVSDYAKELHEGDQLDNSARAWLIAIIKALIAEEQHDRKTTPTMP